jgi:hypothetical protein
VYNYRKYPDPVGTFEEAARSLTVPSGQIIASSASGGGRGDGKADQTLEPNEPFELVMWQPMWHAERGVDRAHSSNLPDEEMQTGMIASYFGGLKLRTIEYKSFSFPQGWPLPLSWEAQIADCNFPFRSTLSADELTRHRVTSADRPIWSDIMEVAYPSKPNKFGVPELSWYHSRHQLVAIRPDSNVKVPVNLAQGTEKTYLMVKTVQKDIHDPNPRVSVVGSHTFKIEAGKAFSDPMPDLSQDNFQSFFSLGRTEQWIFNLLPIDLAIDANRDGTIDSGETASQAKPFRFWVNNDSDPHTLGDDVEDAMKEDEESPPVQPDWNTPVVASKKLIDGVRDLEDFTRLHLTLPFEIIQKAKAGEAQIGFKWTNGSGPRIRLYMAEGDLGDQKYLFYKEAANLQVDSDHQKELLDVNGSQAVYLPSTYWQDVSASDSKLHFIFEGCAKGTAKLTTVIKFGSSAEVEGAGVWIKLMDVQEMFERGKVDAPMSEPDNVPDPWVTNEPLTFQSTSDLNGNAFQADPDEAKQYIIHVHGWRMSYHEAQTWANTSFKRLWQLGYKGRYAFFSWPTYSPATSEFNGYMTYNKSEYRAWLSGAALKSYVHSLPSGYTKSIMAHSMGNVVVGSAFRQGMGGISNYSLFNSAMAAQAYDPTRIDYPTRQTPDTDSDPTVQNRFGLSSKFSGITAKVTNFYLEDDLATRIWSANHVANKPQIILAPLHRYGYSNSGYTVDGTLHKLAQLDPLVLSVPLRGITMTEEAMAFVTQTRSLPAGRTPTNLGFTSGGQLNMDTFIFENDYRSLFGSEHSAEWIWSLQRTFGVWRALLNSFDINPNPVP